MRREKKTAATAWLETWNPLRGMSIRDAQNLFEIAAVAKQAGWTIDQQQLEKATGYTLVKDEAAQPESAPCQPVGADLRAARLPFMNKASTPIQPPQNASGREDVLTAFSKDTGPAGEG